MILVGHSWGGAVITQAGDHPKVAGLVYVAAYAPAIGQSANDASKPFGVTRGADLVEVNRQTSVLLARMTSRTLSSVMPRSRSGRAKPGWTHIRRRLPTSTCRCWTR